MTPKERRQRRIVELLGRNQIDSQDQLVDLMAAEGYRTTQSTLSRDLRELGVVKSPTGYRVPTEDRRRLGEVREVVRAVKPGVASADAGGSVVVLRVREEMDPSTAPRRAGEIAETIDQAQLFQALSAVAVGSIVLVIARTPAYARDLARMFRGR